MNSLKQVADAKQAKPYWAEAREPLVCLVFLAPLLMCYEAGILWLGGRQPDAIRNGADYWMRGWLAQVGFDQALLLPILVVAGLLIWHLFGRYPWRMSGETLVGMFAESLLFAFSLTALAQMQDVLFHNWGSLATLNTGSEEAARVIAYVGAGVYEEVLFRLLLLPACYALFRLFQIPRGWSAALAVIMTSLAFSLAHYVGPTADTFNSFSFTFRMLAGLFFAVLFVVRGFGVTVGSHAAYDIIVGSLLAAEA